MSITITPENFKKYAKRQQKTLSQFLEEHNRVPSLNESQEILAKTLGFSNYHEYLQTINQPSISIVQAFINDLKIVINDKNSTIKKCYITDGYDPYQKNTVSLNMTVDGDEYFVFQFPNHNINNKKFLIKDLKNSGISDYDASAVINLFETYFSNIEYDGLLFAVLANQELNLINKKCFIMKNEPCETYNEFKLNGLIFSRKYSMISHSQFNQVLEECQKPNGNEMLRVERGLFNINFCGGSDIDEKFVLSKIINTSNAFVEFYHCSDIEFHNENEYCNMDYIKNVWLYDGKKLLKYSGIDILRLR